LKFKLCPCYYIMPVSRPSRGVLALLEMVVGCLWKLTMTAGYSIGSDMKYPDTPCIYIC
jgi:hypothetical protein